MSMEGENIRSRALYSPGTYMYVNEHFYYYFVMTHMGVGEYFGGAIF